MNEPHHLTDDQIAILHHILSNFADDIELVGLFGSRATGRARPNSDIDLVLYGAVDAAMVDRIWTLCDESDLSLKVDVNAYDLIEVDALKAHIDLVMHPLFTREQLQEVQLPLSRDQKPLDLSDAVR